MTSKSIYDRNPQLPPRQEYFYIIEHVATKKRYAGSSFAKSTRYIHPDQFWNPNHKYPYFTSSLEIKRIIAAEGIDSFSVIRIKPCDDALSYESKFLKRIHARNNTQWFNRHENDGKFIHTGPHSKETRIKQSLSKRGIKHTDIHRERNAAAKRGKPQSELSNKLRSDKLKGLPKSIITCPICEKSGGEPQMKRWHFDNCKIDKS